MPVRAKTTEIRNLAHEVLLMFYPHMLSVRELTCEINCLCSGTYSVDEVEYALRKFAPFNTHFTFTKDFTTGAVSYGVLDVNDEFHAEEWADR